MNKLYSKVSQTCPFDRENKRVLFQFQVSVSLISTRPCSVVYEGICTYPSVISLQLLFASNANTLHSETNCLLPRLGPMVWLVIFISSVAGSRSRDLSQVISACSRDLHIFPLLKQNCLILRLSAKAEGALVNALVQWKYTISDISSQFQGMLLEVVYRFS